MMPSYLLRHAISLGETFKTFLCPVSRAATTTTWLLAAGATSTSDQLRSFHRCTTSLAWLSKGYRLGDHNGPNKRQVLGIDWIEPTSLVGDNFATWHMSSHGHVSIPKIIQNEQVNIPAKVHFSLVGQGSRVLKQRSKTAGNTVYISVYICIHWFVQKWRTPKTGGVSIHNAHAFRW